jgi:hypothetical protein
MTIAIAALLVACRTTRPSGEPLAPLNASSPAEAQQQLAFRRANFPGERALIRLRTPVNGQMQSARAQLKLDHSLRMLMTIYTPINTSAARLFAGGGDVVFLNDIERTAWRGYAHDFTTRTFNYFGSGLETDTLVLLLVGLPPSADVSLDYTPTGLARAKFNDVVVTYDPPVYPPRRVAISRGDQRMEIEYLQTLSGSEPVRPPLIPRDYRCCLLPQL